MKNNLLDIRLSPQTLVGLFVLVLAVWATITYAGLIVEVFALLFGAFLVSLAIRPLADKLSRWRVPRGVTVLIVYLLILALLAGLGTLTGSAISSEVSQVRSRGPQLIQEASDRLAAIPLLGRLIPSIDTLVQSFSQELRGMAGTLVGAATGASRIVVDVTLVAILAYFFVTDADIGASMLAWVPARHKARAEAVVSNATARLSRWVIAQLLLIVYFAVVYGAGLLVIGVPFAILIAIVGGLLELVPYLGGVIALVLSVLAALTVHPSTVLWVVIWYVVVTQIESHIVLPNLYGHAVDVHPATVLLALLIGAYVGGIFGALFAVPVAVVITAILSEFRKPQPDQPEPDDEDNGEEAAA